MYMYVYVYKYVNINILIVFLMVLSCTNSVQLTNSLEPSLLRTHGNLFLFYFLKPTLFLQKKVVSKTIMAKQQFDLFISLRFSDKRDDDITGWQPLESGKLLKNILEKSHGLKVFLCAVDAGDDIFSEVVPDIRLTPA